MNWLSHFFGLDNLSGPYYGFWSGVGSDIAEIAILGGVVQLYRRHNCHVKGCWRISKRKLLDGTDEMVCNKHHPVPQRTHQEILADHAKYNG